MYLLIIAAPQIIETVVSGGMTAGEIAAICLAVYIKGICNLEIQLRIQVSKNCLLIEYHYASIKMFKYHYASIKMFKSEEINVSLTFLRQIGHESRK
jgi:hypothetical protein